MNIYQKIILNKQQKTYKKQCIGELAEKVEEDLEQIRNGNFLSKIERYFNSFYKEQETILDYLGKKYLIFIDELQKVRQRNDNIELDTENIINALVEKVKIIPDSLKVYANMEELELKLNDKQKIYLNKLDNLNKNSIEKYNFNCRPLSYFKSEIEVLINDLNKFSKENKT